MKKDIFYYIFLFVFFMCNQLLLHATKPLVGTGKSIQGSRPYQQDYFYLAKDTEKPVIALICDGHGDQGDFVAEEVTEQLVKKLNEKTFTDDIPDNSKKIKEVFSDVNAFLKKNMGKDGDTSGAVCIALLCIHNNFYVANAGDSRAVWGVSNDQQTQDHTGKNKNEIARVGASNIHGPQQRLGGTLMVTRAFGDFALTKQGLTQEPDIIVLPVEKIPLIILACDGVWDGTSAKRSPASFQTDDNSLVYELMNRTIVEQKQSVELACKRILVAAICSTLANRAEPLLNLFSICPRTENVGLLIRTIAPVSLDNAVAKIDPFKKELILGLSLEKVNAFIKENQQYAHDNTTVVCIHNQQAEIIPLPISPINISPSKRIPKDTFWQGFKQWWFGGE